MCLHTLLLQSGYSLGWEKSPIHEVNLLRWISWTDCQIMTIKKRKKSHIYINIKQKLFSVHFHICHPTPDTVLITAKANVLLKEAAARPSQTAQSFTVINVLKTKTANRPV